MLPHGVAVVPYLFRPQEARAARRNWGVPTGLWVTVERRRTFVSLRVSCLITVPCLQPQSVHLIPEWEQVKVKGTVRKEAKRRDSGQFGAAWAHVFQVCVGCARGCCGSGGLTRMGCDHGSQVASPPAGLLHPHGQSRTPGRTFTATAFKITWSWKLKFALQLFTETRKQLFQNKTASNLTFNVNNFKKWCISLEWCIYD